jgi:hypothetical protein
MSHQADAFGAGTPLYVDQTNNRLGIGNAAPATALDVDANGATVATFDRATSDGDIVDLRKDGTTVGSIGTVSGGVSLGSGDTGLYFEPVSNEIRPFNTTTNASIDNAINLGNLTKRFKDLYLSGGVKFDGVTKLQGGAYIIGGSAANGIRFNNSNDSQNNVIMNDDGSTWFRNGIYLGATSNPSAANHLDDYEEGALSLSTTTGTASFTFARYTKVGNLVTIRFQVDTFSDLSTASAVVINGLPFASSSTSKTSQGVLGRFMDGGGDAIVAYMAQNASSVTFYKTANNSGYVQVQHNHLTSASALAVVTLTYEAA